MNKNEFLNKLFASLGGISIDEHKRLSQYFSELLLDKMEEGLTEEVAVASFGKPEEVAELIKKDLEESGTELKDAICDMKVLFEGLDITSFDIIAEQTSVVIKPSSDGNFRVSFQKEKNDKVEWLKEGGCFVLRHRAEKELFHFFRGQRTRSMYIEAPKDVIEKFRVQSANARITLNDINVRLSGEVITSNARVSVVNCVCERLFAKTSNAKIAVSDCDIRIMEAKSSNGMMSVKSCEFGEAHCRTSNGKIIIENIKAKQLRLVTSNGSICGTIRGVLEEYSIDSHTSNGSCNPRSRLNENCSAKLYAHTSNASIKISFV